MQHHEICDLIPGMTEKQYEVLRDDIRERGLLNEIVLYEGAILDGKHRYRACVELGIEPRFRQYDGADPAGFVFSINVAHRHLEKGQLAMAGAKLKGYYAEKARQRQAAAGKARHEQLMENFPQADAGSARDQAAAKVGVSGKSVDTAETIIKKGVPKLIEMVETGEISLNKGREIAELSKARQQTVVDIQAPKERDAALKKSMVAKHSKAAKPAPTDNVPGSPLVRTLLSRLEIIANEIAGSGLAPAAFAERFRDEFDWSEPILVARLERAGIAIEAVGSLSLMSQRAKRAA